MAIFLLLLAMMATTSTVFADGYTYVMSCDGNLKNKTTYCPLLERGIIDKNYYEIELLSDRSLKRPGCLDGSYALETTASSTAIRVNMECNGTFGIKPKLNPYPSTNGACGPDRMEQGFKIINGRGAGHCQFPWMAFLVVDWKGHYRFNCGASIVSNRWLLTAGHCIVATGRRHGGKTPPASAIRVRTGSLIKDKNYIERRVDWVVMDPRYDHIYLRYDAVLLRLTSPIRWDGCHSPICLNSVKKIEPGRGWCIVSGWGRSSITSQKWPKKMLWAYDLILTRRKCDETYYGQNQDNILCTYAAKKTSGRAFCAGDSGGPLVCKSKGDGKFYQHGIVSRYRSTAFCKMEGVYTSVANIYDWILDYIERE